MPSDGAAEVGEGIAQRAPSDDAVDDAGATDLAAAVPGHTLPGSSNSDTADAMLAEEEDDVEVSVTNLGHN